MNTEKKPETKQCIICLEHKEVKDFFKRKGSDDGYSTRCKDCEKWKCWNLRDREYY